MNEPADSRLMDENTRTMFEAMAETFTDVVFTALPDGSWDFVNARMYEITGLPVASALGKGWIEALHPEERERVAREMQEAIDSGSQFESHFRLRTSQGEQRRFVARAHFLPGDSGRIARWVGTATDVHDLLAAEDALQQVVRQNDEALSKLTHDLRNVVAPISNAVAILRHPGVDAAQRQRAIEIIDGQVRDLRAFLDKIRSAPPSERNMPAKPETSGPLKQPSRRIIIVSSECDFGEEWSMLLRLAGHNVCAARDIPQALDLGQTFQPEILVVNLPLPAGDDDKWTQRLRMQPELEKTLIVAICNDNDSEPLPRPAVVGCDAVLGKPVKIQDLLKLIAEQGAPHAPRCQ